MNFIFQVREKYFPIKECNYWQTVKLQFGSTTGKHNIHLKTPVSQKKEFFRVATSTTGFEPVFPPINVNCSGLLFGSASVHRRKKLIQYLKGFHFAMASCVLKMKRPTECESVAFSQSPASVSHARLIGKLLFFTSNYFKLGWNISALNQSNCRNF